MPLSDDTLLPAHHEVNEASFAAVLSSNFVTSSVRTPSATSVSSHSSPSKKT